MEKNPDPSSFLNKIINSSTFENKEVQKNLIRFLYDASKEGKVLHEIDIAFDFFKRGNSFNPGDDTIVRVNVYKLRALLDSYYQTEGKNDALVFDLPKGSYSLKFLEKGNEKKRIARKLKSNRYIYLILFSSLLINLVFLFGRNWKSEMKKNPVWTDYLNSDFPTCITLGDPYFFRAASDSLDEGIVVRDITINSAEDLLKSKEDRFFSKNMKIKALDYPYLSTNNVRPLPAIISIFAKANKDIRLQTLSETNIEDVKRNNQIFIGNINSFGFFNKFLEKTSIRLHTNPREIIIEKNETDSLVLKVPEKVKGYYVDYAFMAKIPGVNNTILSLMGDFHASGIMGLSNFMTDKTSIANFEKNTIDNYGKFPEFFEIVVKVTSYNYHDFKTEVIYFNPLNR